MRNWLYLSVWISCLFRNMESKSWTSIWNLGAIGSCGIQSLKSEWQHLSNWWILRLHHLKRFPNCNGKEFFKILNSFHLVKFFGPGMRSTCSCKDYFHDNFCVYVLCVIAIGNVTEIERTWSQNLKKSPHHPKTGSLLGVSEWLGPVHCPNRHHLEATASQEYRRRPPRSSGKGLPGVKSAASQELRCTYSQETWADSATTIDSDSRKRFISQRAISHPTKNENQKNGWHDICSSFTPFLCLRVHPSQKFQHFQFSFLSTNTIYCSNFSWADFVGWKLLSNQPPPARRGPSVKRLRFSFILHFVLLFHD